MRNDIREAIEEFEKHNGICISNYYYKDKATDRMTLKDGYIGEDIFEKRIEEWLEICEDEEDRKYLLDLLKEYLYFPADRYTDEVDRLIQLLGQEGVCIEDTLFVTFPSKKGVASGGASLSSALTLAIMYMGQKENIITDVAKASTELMDFIHKCKYVVFMDDIIGSGKTLNTNISDFFDRFCFEDDTVFYIAALCGRKRKVQEKIKQFQARYHKQFKSILLYPVEKCIDEKIKENNEHRKEKMLSIERTIEEHASEEDGKSYIMGFEGNQLLVSFYYNTPNNTMSMFWRPSSISVPLFLRTSYKRPSITECRAKKEQMKRNAYERGRLIANDVDDTYHNPVVYP